MHMLSLLKYDYCIISLFAARRVGTTASHDIREISIAHVGRCNHPHSNFAQNKNMIVN